MQKKEFVGLFVFLGIEDLKKYRVGSFRRKLTKMFLAGRQKIGTVFVGVSILGFKGKIRY